MDSATLKTKARNLLTKYRGDNYAFGLNVIDRIGPYAKAFGGSTLLIANEKGSAKGILNEVKASLTSAGVSLAGGRIAPGAGPNSPKEDAYRLESYIMHYRPDSITVVGGGSPIDAAKAANVLARLGDQEPEVEAYFGTGLVAKALEKTGRKLIPFLAVETASSSGSHLTKYSNITDPMIGQKKLIIDEAIVPVRAVFDYTVTATMPARLTIDGALDGFSHCLEVFYGAAPDKYALISEIALLGIELVVRYTKKALDNPMDLDAREALGLATDLGGYAIMVGGTSGGHLTSFSLVDITTHGQACGIMNPYYTVLFSPAIERQLKALGSIFAEHGYMMGGYETLSGRALGEAVASGMISFIHSLGSPTTLRELPGFTQGHIDRALDAAKDPQLESKLKNMPTPLTSSTVDEYMAPVLNAAATGDFKSIKVM